MNLKPAINIYSGSSIPFAAALTNPTELAKAKGKIKRSYPVSFRDNPFRPANLNLKIERYANDKPAGKPFVSAEDAYQYFKTDLNDDQKYELAIKILTAKLVQYPVLTETIGKSGGVRWLRTCFHQPTPYETFWTGTGYNSGFVSALIAAYREVTPSTTAVLPEAEDNEERSREVLSKYLSYDAISQQLYISFNNQFKAKEWGRHLNQELYIGEEYSLEDSSRLGWKYVLVVSRVDEHAARMLAEITNFGRRPSSDNPRNP